jgi:hypothetical protein
MATVPLPAQYANGEFGAGKIMLDIRKIAGRSFLTGQKFGTIAMANVLAFSFVCLASPRAYGDVGVVLNESMDTSMDRITGTGHSAVYFSRICAESPVKLRLCGPGEQGSVMSNYINIGEDQPFEWNVVPLNIYLYGVEDSRHRPIFGSFKLKHLLEQRYREKYLSGLCDGSSCTTSPKAEWREMVAATFIRSIYIFAVDTTVERDKELIAEFNDAPNKNHFNGVTWNCADFTRHAINTYFPHAASPDYVNDFGMTTPKAVARSFTHYALRHPELNFRVMHFAQVPGTIKRSSEVRAGTEQLYHSKKFLIPMIVFADYELPAVAATYMLTGRFNPEREFEQHPSTETDAARTWQQLDADSPDKQTRPAGTSRQWREYHKALDAIVQEEIQNGIVHSRKELDHFFKHFDEAGTPTVEKDGASWMEFAENGRSIRVGLSANNTFSPGSDPQLAYELLLARAQYVLKSPKHRRETMIEFKQDWTKLQRASAKNAVNVARNVISGKGRENTPGANDGDD